MKQFSNKAIHLMSTSASKKGENTKKKKKKPEEWIKHFSGSDLGKHLGQNSQNIWPQRIHQSCYYRLTAVINRNSLWTMNDIVSGFPPFIHFSYTSNRMSQFSVHFPAVWISLALFRGGACYSLVWTQMSNNGALFSLATARGGASVLLYAAHTLTRIYCNYKVCKNQATID